MFRRSWNICYCQEQKKKITETVNRIPNKIFDNEWISVLYIFFIIYIIKSTIYTFIPIIISIGKTIDYHLFFLTIASAFVQLKILIID